MSASLKHAVPVVAGETWPAMLAVVFVLPALRFLAQPGFPLSDDGLNHLLQIASFAQSIDQGDLYPRWSPLLNLQYGSPIFSYYAPLPFYLAELGRLAPLSLTESLKFVFGASIVLSCLAMYLLGRELAGRAVGFVAGVTYGLLPYLLHDVYSRSELGEALGLALLPAILFGLTRYAHTRRPCWLGVGAIGVACLFLTHSISVVMYLPFVALWSVVLAFAEGSGRPSWRARIRLIAQLLAGVGLNAGLAAFFWLPAFAEKDFVQLQRTVSRDVLHGYLVPRFWPPIEGSWLFDYRYGLPHQFPFQPGLVQVILGAVGVMVFVVWHAQRPAQRSGIWFLVILVVLPPILWLQTVQSEPVWLFLPLLPYLQFPYRLLGLFGFITALMTGYVVVIAPNQAARASLAAALAAIALVVGLARLHPTMRVGTPSEPDARWMLRTEAALGNFSGTAGSEYTPRWVTLPTHDIIQSALPTSATYFPMVSASPDESVQVVRAEGSSLDVRVTSRRAMTLVLRRFSMPQWQATVGGRQLPLRPVGWLGLLGIDVPAGDSLVQVRYGRTALDTASIGVSVASAALLLVWTTGLLQSRARIARRGVLAAGVIACAIVALMFLGRRLAQQDAIETVEVPAGTVLAHGFQLAGVQIDRRLLAKQSTLRLTAYVYGTRAGDDLWFHVRVQDRQGRIVTETNTRPWNGGTSAWTVGELAPAMIDIVMPSQTPNDPLQVSIATDDSELSNDRLSFFTVATVAPSDLTSPVFHPLYAEFDNKLAIEGYRVTPREHQGQVDLQAGQSVDMTLYFQAAQPIFENVKVFLHLVDDKGTVWAQHDDLAGEIQHPSGSWRPGEFVQQDFSLALPREAPAGQYRIEVGSYRPASGQRLSVAGTDRPVVDNAVVLSTTVRANARP